MKHYFLYLSTACLLLSGSPASAEETENPFDGLLLGDWGGARQTLSDHGVDTEITYTADIIGNTSGGVKESTRALDNLDVIINIDAEKLVGWEGGSASIYLLNNNGGRPDADLVGSAQGIDNIEVPRSATRLYEAWIQQNVLDDRLSVRAGLYDLNSEFYATDPADLFLHSTYGIGSEIAASGQNGPSIFPFTSVGVRIKVQPTPEFYIQSAVLDGVPGDTDKLRGTHFQFGGDEGALIVAEAGYVQGGDENPEGKIALGGWYYTQPFADFVTGSEEHSYGYYIIADHMLYHEPGSEDQGIVAFARFGIANGDVNPFNYAWSTGLVYTGIFPGRDEGQLGFGINGVHNSDTFRDAAVIAGAPLDSAETALELTYSDNITPWLTVQPDVQYIINPGTDPALDNALVVGARAAVAF